MTTHANRAGRSSWGPALLLLCSWVALAAGPSVAQAPGRVRIGKLHRLKVTHTTRVRVAADLARLQVFQAKPRVRDWPGLEAPLAVEKVTLVPEGGKEVATKSEGGFAWTWEQAEPAAGEVDFVSTFEVLSADRDLKTSGLEIRWADLPEDSSEIMQGLPALPVANEVLRAAVAKIKRKERNVLDALNGFAQWVNQNIAYTPGVAYGSEDLEAICKGRGGHCGHRATVYLALCQAAGIPARRVVGYALFNTTLAGGGVDDTNRHVWVEVSLPNLGWVEVEPAPKGSPFAISYLFVMCPFDLQSRFVEANSKAGVRTLPVVSDTLRMDEVR